MSAMGGKRTLVLGLTRIVEFPDLDSAFIEIVEQAAEVFPKSLPMGAAAADGAVMNADHSVAPDISCRSGMIRT